jgi:hypothetical protein
MGIEFRQGMKRLAEIPGDLKRGHTLQQEADVRRILTGNISTKDIEKYNKDSIELTTFLFYFGNIDKVVDLIYKTQFFSNPKAGILEEAKAKAEKWKLKPNA